MVEEKAKSRLLLSIETSVELGVMHITNRTTVQEEPGGVSASKSEFQEIILEYPEVFSGLDKRHSITA